jgi:dolichol-phosphate mannosyltransferase
VKVDGLARTSAEVDLSVLLPVLDERDNLEALLPRLGRVLAGLDCRSEVLVVDGGSTDGTPEAARRLAARVLVQRERGYGGAMRKGFAAARGRYILTLDADLSHDPDFIRKLWRARNTADILVASRYVKGGVAYMPLHRKVLSRVLNRFFAIGLGLPTRDLSSGFRLYRTSTLDQLETHGRDFDVLEEILVKAYAEGWRVVEIPFTYHPREHGSSHARIACFGLALVTSFGRLWPLRNSIESADYDERAFFSRIPLQRYWQRRRHRIITTCARGAGHTLDVGCGSSVILQSLNDAVGLDILAIKFATCDDMVFPLYRARSWRCPSAKQASAALFILPALFIVIGGLAILRIRDLVDILLG